MNETPAVTARFLTVEPRPPRGGTVSNTQRGVTLCAHLSHL